MRPSDKSTAMFPDDILSLEAEGGDTHDFPVYGNDLPAVLAPEHFLWQLKGRYPGFDEELQTLYRTQSEHGAIPKEHWPEGVLVPADFYLEAFVVPQMLGEPAQGYEDWAGKPAGEDEMIEFGDDFDLPPEDEPGDTPPFPLEENSEELVSIAQSRLAAANWEVYKDIVVYPPEDFRAIVQGGRGLKGLLPDSLFLPMRSLALWISLAGLSFDIHGEDCLGCFVFRGWNALGGDTLCVGFVSKNSYYDYTIPLTPHASLDYIIDSALDFMAKEAAERGDTEPFPRESIASDLRSAWGRILPVIVHVLENLPENVAMGRRREPARQMLCERFESRSVHLWRWSRASSRFSHAKHPSVFSSPVRKELLREFVRSEEQGPIEVTEIPGEKRVLN